MSDPYTSPEGMLYATESLERCDRAVAMWVRAQALREEVAIYSNDEADKQQHADTLPVLPALYCGPFGVISSQSWRSVFDVVRSARNKHKIRIAERLEGDGDRLLYAMIAEEAYEGYYEDRG